MLARPQRYHQNHHDKHTARTHRRRPIVQIVRAQHLIYIYIYTHTGPNFSTWTMAPRERGGAAKSKTGPLVLSNLNIITSARHKIAYYTMENLIRGP